MAVGGAVQPDAVDGDGTAGSLTMRWRHLDDTYLLVTSRHE
jgi:hypothetical protein